MKSIPVDYDTPAYVRGQLSKYRDFLEGRGHWREKWLVMEGLVGDVSGKTVVDLGCSIGTYALQAAIRAKIAVGLDRSMSALRTARSLSPQATTGSRPAVFVCNDVSAICLKDGSADIVLGVDIVEHLPPNALDAMLSEAYRILKKGGRLVLQTYPSRYYYFFMRPNKYTLLALPALLLPSRAVPRYLEAVHRMISALRSLAERARGRRHEQAHCNCQTPADIAAHVRAAGFSIEKELTENTYQEYERTRHGRLWERMLRHHEVTRNNIYVSATKQ